MTNWNELTPRERPVGLPAAIKRQISPGVYRYSFVHDDVEIDDPSIDLTGRFFVSPREYGFAIRGFPEGKTAWVRDFDNGTMLAMFELSEVIANETSSSGNTDFSQLLGA